MPVDIKINAETDSILNLIQERLEKNIYYAALHKTENLYHPERDEVIRAYFFSKGEREECIVIGADGYIHFMFCFTERNVSKDLMFDVMISLCDLIKEGVLLFRQNNSYN